MCTKPVNASILQTGETVKARINSWPVSLKPPLCLENMQRDQSLNRRDHIRSDYVWLRSVKLLRFETTRLAYSERRPCGYMEVFIDQMERHHFYAKNFSIETVLITIHDATYQQYCYRRYSLVCRHRTSVDNITIC